MSGLMRVSHARRRTARLRKNDIEIYDSAGDVVFTGKCIFRAAEANQGQLSEPDPIEADVSSYESYDIWIKYAEDLLNDIREGYTCEIEGRVELTITAVEQDASNKAAIQLRGVKQRTSTPYLDLVLIRIDPDTGDEEVLDPQEAQVVLEGATPIGAGAEVTGGSTAYLQGFLIFRDRDADVMAGDRFKYQGRWGEVTGLPTVANDRKEVRMRLTGGGI